MHKTRYLAPFARRIEPVPFSPSRLNISRTGEYTVTMATGEPRHLLDSVLISTTRRSMKVKATMRLTREGSYYLALTVLVFSGAMMRDVNLLLMLSGLVLGPLLFSGYAISVTMARLTGRRRLPDEICAGDLLVVGAAVENARSRGGAWSVVFIDRISRKPIYENQAVLGGDELAATSAIVEPGIEAPIIPRVLFPHIPAGREREGSYRGQLTRRGLYEFGPLTIASHFPFGLIRRRVRDESIERLIVYPRIGYLTSEWAQRQWEAFSGSSSRRSRPGADGDFHGLRPWRRGDSMRQIHWRSYARTGRLLVREFQRPESRDLAIVLDLWLPKNPSDRQLVRVELAVSFAATLLTDSCRRGGSNIVLGTFDVRPSVIHGSACPSLLTQALRQLAIVPGRSDDQVDTLLAKVAAQIDDATEVILVSTREAEQRGVSPDTDGRSQAGRTSSRIRRINVACGELMRCFQIDPPGNSGPTSPPAGTGRPEHTRIAGGPMS